MEARLGSIRDRITFAGGEQAEYIGCTMLVQPTFFPPEAWIPQPTDWRIRTQTDKKYDLENGEGRRVWEACISTASDLKLPIASRLTAENRERFGQPVLVRPRLGQRIFRIAVTDAYHRACVATGEHSLPALEAGHIMPYHDGGPHEISNGLLFRADLHRLFDKGYIGVDKKLELIVSDRLRREFKNGHTYYPLQGVTLRLPQSVRNHPDPEFLRWHREHVFAG